MTDDNLTPKEKAELAAEIGIGLIPYVGGPLQTLYFGSKVDKIPILKTQKFANDMFAEYVTFSQLISNASRVINFAIKLNYATINPFDRIERPRSQEEIEDDVQLNFYTRDELNTFLSFVKEDYDLKRYAYFRTIAYTGFRKGEMLALNWEDVDFENKTI